MNSMRGRIYTGSNMVRPQLEQEHEPKGIITNTKPKINEDEDNITPQYIIKNKPSTKIVREFFEYNLKSIVDEDERCFIEQDK